MMWGRRVRGVGNDFSFAGRHFRASERAFGKFAKVPPVTWLKGVDLHFRATGVIWNPTELQFSGG